MNHEHWDEERIEKLLSKVPKIHDTRSKEEVLERLKKDGVFDEEPPKKSPRINLLPWMIAACAVLFIAILIPSLMKKDSTADEASTANDSSGEDMGILGVPDNLEEQEKFVNVMTVGTDNRTAVYPDQTEGNTLFRIGLASKDADSIPVTIVIPNEKILEDFGKNDPSQVEMYKVYAPRLNEQALGFIDYHPYEGEITEKNGKVIHVLPENHPYDVASAALSTYFATLTNTFSSYSEVEFADQNHQPKILKEVGKEYSLQITKETTQYSYFKYVQEDGSAFLAPNFRETFPNVEKAMEALKVNTNDVYQSVILPNVDYSVSVEKDLVKITFKEPLDLFNYNQVEAMQMIEGMLLTAAGFNKAVQFENIVQSEWEGFDFSKPLPIPVGPNKLPYTVLENE